MLVIDKKRIMMILSSIMLSVFVVAFSVGEVKDTVMTVATPVSNKVIILDAGHGYPDERDCLLKF